MPRKRKDCPICGRRNLLKLSNHLADFHQLSCEEREQHLTQARLSSSVNDKETLVPGEEQDIKKTLEIILKRQDNMQANLNEYIRVARKPREQSDSNKAQRRSVKCPTKKKRRITTHLQHRTSI